MKLYTEEQVLTILDLAKLKLNNDEKYSKDELINSLTPIELPSDEEIMNNAYTDRTVDDWEHEQQVGFELGAKWMKEQILNQNK